MMQPLFESFFIGPLLSQETIVLYISYKYFVKKYKTTDESTISFRKSALALVFCTKLTLPIGGNAILSQTKLEL